MKQDNLYQKLMDYQRGLKKVDTHEHISSPRYAQQVGGGIFEVLLTPYTTDSFFSAGCSRQEYDFMISDAPFSQRYEIFAKYWALCRYTAFARAAALSVQHNFGISDLSEQSLLEAEEKLAEERKGDYYTRYREELGFEAILSFLPYNAFSDYRGERYYGVPTVSDLVLNRKSRLRELEQMTGLQIYDLNTLGQGLEILFQKYVQAGAVAVKFGSAYRRRLNFQQPDEQKAALEFSQVLSIREMGDDRFLGRHEPSLPMEQVLALDDWMTHRMLFLCAKYRLPAVFHVALHAFNENNIDRCHAQDLNDLVASHPDTRFLILHCGMPFVEEAVTLARYFPNVWLDFTWAHTISPSITQRLIKMVLELVPIHKVLAFGGDLCHLQTIYGYLEVAMENLAQVFQEEIALGHMEEQQAKDILKKWFYDNPSAFYGLNLPPVH